MGRRQVGWQAMGRRQVGWQAMGRPQVGWQVMGRPQVGWRPMVNRTEIKHKRNKTWLWRHKARLRRQKVLLRAEIATQALHFWRSIAMQTRAMACGREACALAFRMARERLLWISMEI
jgi:hypothetical protein